MRAAGISYPGYIYYEAGQYTQNMVNTFRLRYFRGRVSNLNQSEARKQCFLASDWLKFETLPRKYRTLYNSYTML